MIKPALVTRLALLLPFLYMGGCTTVSDALSSDKVDYKSSTTQVHRDVLELPPDINALPRDDHFNMSDKNGGSATFSEFNKQESRPVGTPAPGAPVVLPIVAGAHMERAGGQRWLVVNRTPDQLWPVVREFWQENGFQLKIDSPDTGIIET